MVERDNITLAWRIVFTGTRASLLQRATPGPPTRLPDKRDLRDLEEDFRELGIPMKCLPFDESIHLSSVSPGSVELLWPDRPARSPLYTDLKTFFHKARPDTVTKRLIGAVMMYCLPPSTTNLQHISMDVEPMAMFADPDFNPDLWQLRREVLKHQKKSFNSPPQATQIFQPGTTDIVPSNMYPSRIKRESPSDADLGFQDRLLNGVSSTRPHTPPKEQLGLSSRTTHSPTGQPLPGTRILDLDRARNSQGSWEPHASGAAISERAPRGVNFSVPVLSEGLHASPDTRGSHTVIPRKRTFSDASASQNQPRPSHASELDQDRDGGYMRRVAYSSDALRNFGDENGDRQRNSARDYDPFGGRDRDNHDYGGYTNGRPRNGSQSYRRRDSDGFAAMDNGSSSRRDTRDDARSANGNPTKPTSPMRFTDTLDRILASPSYGRMELDTDLPAPQSASQQETPAPEPKLSNLDVMALKAKIPRIEAERDAARARARELEDDLAGARRGAGRERDLEDEVASWRTRAEDAVYRSDVLADRLKRLLAGELPDGLNPDADEAITLLGHVLNRMRRDVAQAEAERARYDSLSRELETLVAHRDTIPPLIEALQQIADATRNIRLP
ncbi:hypothetical protein PENSPDRAFT_738344 [Peniophora sp. CONT]|nr:hypothetical protein PENSPDRAFT_738344 [Peniophora sp. CONT]